MKRIFTFLLLPALTLILLNSARGAGLIIVEPPPGDVIPLPMPHPPRPMPPPWRPVQRFLPLEVQSVKANVQITDQVAQTRILQEFYNPNSRQLEGTFLFPLPKGAHLQKFSMEINGKMTEAELLTAEKAKGIYEEIVRKAKDPALLEYVGRDLVKVRIFPIEANATKRIEVTYTELLRKDDGMVAYTLPLNTAKYCSAPVKNLSLKLDLKSSTSLKSIYSPSHTVEVLRNTGNTATIGFEQRDVIPDKDLQLFYSAQEQELGLNFLTYRKPGEDGYFMLLATPGFESRKARVLPRDVVFVIDTSGSMAGTKMDQARKALLFCVNSLNEQDRFEIIRFSTETESLFKELRKVSSSSKKEAEQFVNDLKAIGGTAIDAALKKALDTRPTASSRPYMVVFLTDGLPTVGETREEEILKTVRRSSETPTRIFCFGLGTDVNTRLLDSIAEETRAVGQYVLPSEDLEVKLGSFFSKISDPVLVDVQVDFGNIRAHKMHPGNVPDLFKGQQLIVLGRYSGEGGTTVTVKGKIGDEEKTFRYPVSFAAANQEHAFIPRLWATRRVGYLLDEIRFHGENAELKDEITSLGKTYQIVTPYTSFLITEDQPVPASTTAVSRRQGEAGDPLTFYRSNPQLMNRYFPQAKAQSSGDSAVAGARYGSNLKLATTEQEVRLAPEELRSFASTGKFVNGGGAAKPNPVRYVGARTFAREGDFWIEATLRDARTTSAVRLEFDSAQYWQFVGAHPELRDVLALGTDIRFQVDGRIYEVFSKNK